MSMPRDGAGTVFRSRRIAPLACLLLAGCVSTQDAGTAQEGSAAAPVDWLNRTYSVTCDGIVPTGLSATVVDGRVRVDADVGQAPFYDYYDVRIADTATGDVDGDGQPDGVVLLECSPQPSNGIVQEVQVFSSAGSPLGTLPSPRTLQGDAPLPPEYDTAALSVEHGEIVAAMKAYGPDDFHASGPSVPVVLRWRFDGKDFVRVSS
jgi:hypothetical protein